MSSNKYGYVADTGPEQSFGNNTGVFDPADINNLIADNKWTNYGQLELIETQTISGTPSTLSFDSIKETEYNVHLVTINNYAPSSDDRSLTVLFKVGGTATTASDYQYAMQRQTGASPAEKKNTADNRIYLAYNSGSSSSETTNGYFYIYNAGDSSKFTFLTSIVTLINRDANYTTMFGSGVYDQANQVNGFQLQTSLGNLEQGVFSLYGLRFS